MTDRAKVDIRLSDHAILRYLERVWGIDMDTVREEILTPTVVDAIRAGASSVRVNGAMLIVENKCIVTALDATVSLRRRIPVARTWA